MARIGGAFIEVSPIFPGLQKKARSEAGKLEQTFGRSGNSSGRSFASALGKVVKTGAVVTGAAAAGAIGFALKKGFERLVDIENATASLTGLGHSADSVQKIMDNALASVKGTSFGMGEAAKTAAAAVAAGVKPGEDLERTLRLVGDAATIGQVSMGEMGMIFNKVAASGKIQASEANMLMERGIPIWAMLADSMGLTEEQVQKLSREGKIGFADFQKAMEEGLGGAALEVGNTTMGALANIGAAAGRLGATFLQGAFPLIRPLFASIIGVIDRLTDAAQPLGDAFGKMLTPAIEGLTTWLDRLDFTSLQSFLASATPLADSTAGGMGGLQAVMAAIAPTGRALGVVFRAVSGTLGFLASHIDTVVKLLPFIVAGMIAWNLASRVAAAATFNLRVAEAAMAPVYLANQALRLTNIILERQGAAAKDTATLATVRNSAATGTNTAALSGNRATSLLSAAATKWHTTMTQGLTRQFIAQRASTAASTVAMVGHRVATLAGAAAARTAAVAQRALNLAMRAGPWMLVVGLIAAVAYGLQQFFTKTDEGRALWTQFTTDLTDAFAPVREAFAELQPVIGELMATFAQLGGEIMQTVVGALSELMPPVMGLVSGLVTGLMPVMVQLVSSLFPVLATVITAVVGAAVPLVKLLLSVLVPVLKVVGAVLAWLINGISGFIGGLTQALGVLFTGDFAGGQLEEDSPVIGFFFRVRDIAGQVVDWFTKTALPFLKRVFEGIGQVALWLWKNAILPAFNGIRAVIGVVVSVVTAILQGIGWFIQTVLAPIFSFLWSVVKVAFQMIRSIIQVWWAITSAIFGAVVSFVKAVLAPIFNFLWSAVKVAFQLIRSAIQVWWAGVSIIFKAVVGFVKNTLGPIFQWFYNSVIKPIWSGIQWVISTSWSGMKITFNAAVGFVKNTLGPIFQWFYTSVIKPVWDNIKSAISTTWNWIKTNVFDPLKSAIETTLPKAFRAGRDAIGKAWDGLKKKAGEPVKFVLQTVVNDGIIAGWNRIAKTFQATEVDPVKVPRFRRGGKVWGEGTETSDSIPAMLSRNEHVWTAREVRNAGGHGSMYRLRELARLGRLPALATGGTLMDAADWWIAKGARPSRHSRFNGGRRISSGHSRNSYHYRDLAVDFNYGPGGENAIEKAFFDRHIGEFQRLFKGIRTIWRAPGHFNHLHIDTAKGANMGSSGEGGVSLDSFLGPFSGLFDKITKGIRGAGQWGDLVAGGAKKVVQMPIDWITENAAKFLDFVGDAWDNVKEGTGRARGLAWAGAKGWPLNGSRWKALDFIVKRESSWDPNAKNPRSSASGLGQFIDANARHYLGSAPMRKHPFGAQLDAIVQYTSDRYGGLVPARKYWERNRHYAGGGAVMPSLYDDGGWLPPGLTTVLNATGKPEAVFTGAQLKMLAASAKAGSYSGPQIQFGDVYGHSVDEVVDRVVTQIRREEAVRGRALL